MPHDFFFSAHLHSLSHLISASVAFNINALTLMFGGAHQTTVRFLISLMNIIMWSTGIPHKWHCYPWLQTQWHFWNNLFWDFLIAARQIFPQHWELLLIPTLAVWFKSLSDILWIKLYLLKRGKKMSSFKMWISWLVFIETVKFKGYLT